MAIEQLHNLNLADIMERKSVVSPEAIPQELRQVAQWVCWRYVARDNGRKPDKRPINPRTLRNAGVNWPRTWADFDQAREVALAHELGLGFVLTEEDPYTCVDLDDCIDAQGSIDLQTREILDLLSGWVELSPSGRGLHIWVCNDIPVSRRTPGLEIYSYGRWMSVTGRSNPNCPRAIPERTDAVRELCDRFLPDVERPTIMPSSPVPMNDMAVWDQLFYGENGEFYAKLFDGDISVCRNDHSLAVILLANQLAVLTDFDAERMKRLLFESLLARDKWQEPRGNITWIDYQIQDAIAYMSGRRVQPPAISDPPQND